MSAIFRIGQSTVFGSYGIARNDLLPFSVGGAITLEAQLLTYASYDWDVVGSPTDGAPPILTPGVASCTVQLEEPGGYLLRLTVDAGLTTEDVSVLFVGIVLANSGLSLPSEFETNQDNSLAPYDGSQGWWYKQERFNKWVDANIGSGMFDWWDFVETSVPLTLDASYGGKTIIVTGGSIPPPPFEMGLRGGVGGGLEPLIGEPGGAVTITLPPVSISEGMWVRIMQGSTVIPQVTVDGGGGDGPEIEYVGPGPDYIYKVGAFPAPTTSITAWSDRASAPGCYVELVCTSSGWQIIGGDGVWIDDADASVRYVLGGNVVDYVTLIPPDLLGPGYPIVIFDSHGQLGSSGTTVDALAPATAPMAIFSDVRPAGTDGGHGLGAVWMARMLTNERYNSDPDGIVLQKFTIIDLDQGNSLFYVAGDQVVHFSEGRYMSVRGSTGNDREGLEGSGDTEPYTIVEALYDDEEDVTSIEVNEAIGSAVVDGSIYTGRIYLAPVATYEILIQAENCKAKNAAVRFVERTGCTYVDGGVGLIGATKTEQGSNSYSDTLTDANMHSHLDAVVSPSIGGYWEIHHYLEDATNDPPFLMGKAVDSPAGMATAADEHYCVVTIRRITARISGVM